MTLKVSETQTQTPVRYFHRCPNQVLILDPRDYERDRFGKAGRQTPGIRIEFDHNYATIAQDAKGRTTVNGRRVDIPFDALCEELNSHDHYGTTLYMDGDAPNEQKPSISDLKAEIRHAMDTSDRGYLEELKELEEGSHRRDTVLQLLDFALETVGEPETEPTGAGVSD